MERFSTVLIARNEESTIERLLSKLRESDKDMDIVILDTGSTDKTVEIGKKYKCNVIEVGDMFKFEATQEDHDRLMDKYGITPAFNPGERYFHFANARNYASTFAKNDWIFCPDADEVPNWNYEGVLDDINKEGVSHLEYKFCYAYDDNGCCLIEFNHSKFFRKSKLEWVGWIHEILKPKQEQIYPFFTNNIYHKHYQNKETNRSTYLQGLELTCARGENLDRNMYYLSREYYYRGEFEKAIGFYKDAIENYITWNEEKSQAMIEMAMCYYYLGDINSAINNLLLSLSVCSHRRETFVHLSDIYMAKGEYKRAAEWLELSLAIANSTGSYLSNQALYTYDVYNRLASIYSTHLQIFDLAKYYFAKAVENGLPYEYYRNGFDFFFKDNGKEYIVFPKVNKKRQEEIKKHVEDNAGWWNYELIFGNNAGIKKICHKYNSISDFKNGEIMKKKCCNYLKTML